MSNKKNVELTCNALSHVDEILLDNKAEETNKNDDTLCSFDDGAIFQQCEQTTYYPAFSNANGGDDGGDDDACCNAPGRRTNTNHNMFHDHL